MQSIWVVVLCLLAVYPYLAYCKCRMDPKATHSNCGLPDELSNFQGFFECDDRVKVGKPRSVSEIQSIVQTFPKVKAVGVGHSWWKEQFCSGDDEYSVNIVMTELPEVQKLITTKDTNQYASSPEFPIQLDEQKRTVKVAAGVPQRMLLDYLSEYSSNESPDGWTLPTFPWFIDQTIGGAVSTGSHGSSLTYGSLSSLVVSMDVVLANGTATTITPKQPHLFKAFLVQVGRLGVTTHLTLKVRPQRLHERRSTEMKFEKFVNQLRRIQDAYRRVKKTGRQDLIQEVLRPLDETHAFWYVPTEDVLKIDYQSVGDKQESSGSFEPSIRSFSGPDHSSVYVQEERKRVAPNTFLRWGSQGWSNSFKGTLRPRIMPGVYETRKAYVTMSEDMNSYHAGFTAYDQYEVSVPMEDMADCLQNVGAAVYGDAELWDGFRTPILIRFVAGEDAYLSNTNGGPRIYFNLEDYVSYNTGSTNKKFQKVMALFRKQCKARMHWGKAGWPRHSPCFDGAKEYPETWCDFGCAVEQLDPKGKFSGQSDVWEWSATTKKGKKVEFGTCCDVQGFIHAKCICAPRKSC